jgi:hypothetical protein
LKKFIAIAVLLVVAIFFITQKYYTLRVVNVISACSHQQVTYSRAFYNPFTSDITFKELALKNMGSNEYNIKAERVKAFDLHRAEERLIIPVYIIAENTDMPIVEQTVGKIEISDITASRSNTIISLNVVIKNLSLSSDDAVLTWQCNLY